MAVRFLIGPAGSGKTFHCLESLRGLERAGQPGVYLVPEQFTYSADRELLQPADLVGLRHVRVLSFTRLAWWVRERAGEAPLQTLDDAVRPMILRSVLARMDAEVLGPLAGMRARPGLLQQLPVLSEKFATRGRSTFWRPSSNARGDSSAGASSRGAASSWPEASKSGGAPSSPASTARSAPPPPGILHKLRSLAEVYSAYASRLREMGRCDPEERLFGLEPLIAQDAELADWTVYVDGFLSWTRRESELLVALALRGVRLEIALCCDLSEWNDPRVPFRPVLRSLQKLEARLVRAGVEVESPRRFPGDHPTRFRNPSLAEIERRLYQLALPPTRVPDLPLAGMGRPSAGPDPTHGLPAAPGASDPHAPATHLADVATASDTRAVHMREARDRRQEVILWARQIDRWTRLDPQPVAREAISVLVRDVDPYRDLVREIFTRYEIPFFLDERRSVLAHPRVRLLLGAFEVSLSEWRREAVIALLRNSLLGNPPAVVDLLENLSLEYGRNYERWYDETWVEYLQPPRARFHDSSDPVLPTPPDEQTHDDEEGEEDPEVEEPNREDGEDIREQRRVLLTEPLRRRFLLPLAAFERRWRSEEWTGAQAVAELSALLGAFSARPSPARDWEQRVEVALSGLLEEMSRIWANLPVSLDEFARTLREGLLALRLGVTPIKQDQVLIGDVQRSRVHGLGRVIVGGVNDGIFPRAVADDPVLGERDRTVLAELGLQLGPTAQQRQEEEAYLFYIGLTRASEEVLITWARLDPEGREMPRSPLLDELIELIPEIDRSAEISPDPDELAVPRVQTSRELGGKLLAYLARLVRSDSEAGENLPSAIAGQVTVEETVTAEEVAAQKTTITEEGTVEEAVPAEDVTVQEAVIAEEATLQMAVELVTDPSASARSSSLSAEPVLDDVRAEFARGSAALATAVASFLPQELLAQLYPDRVIASSVSRLQEFASCPFQSFARSILRLERRPEARVTPLETGALAHAALERFFAVPRDADRRSARLVEIFGELAPLPEYQGFQMDDASRFRWEATRRALDRFLAVELDRLGKSAYRIEACEKSFGMGEPGLELPLPDGKTLLLRGRIDRLDVREDDGGRRALVIDYKRSQRSGLPGTLEAGVDLQLAVYLLFVREVEGMIPSGGLYVPVVPSPPRSEKLLAVASNRLGIRAHGFVLADEAARIDSGLEFLVKGRSGQKVASAQKMEELLSTARRYLISYATTQSRGWIAARPLLRESRLPCERCEVGAVCRYRKGVDPRRRDAAEGMVPVAPPGSSSAEVTA